MEEDKQRKVGKRIVVGQIVFLVLVMALIYTIYPRSNVSVSGNFVKFEADNADVIMISNNPDFSNPRFLDMQERNNYTFNLEPGTYYWKPTNDYLGGFRGKFTIQSEVGLGVEEGEDTRLVNIGNVKLNITKTEDGKTVGRIILEPEEKTAIEDSGEYIGRQEDGA